MNYKEFKVLAYIEKQNGKKISQRIISDKLGLSLGSVNKIIANLQSSNFINANLIVTNKGYKQLEPYKVKRAIFLAAGFGSRLVPITLNTPKPLIRVHGKKIIETLIDAVVKAGIKEIIIVRGYLKEQFDVLLQKYPNIKFIDNPVYNETNNISSAFLARDYFENAYILESDLFLYNEDLIQKYEYESNYLGREVKETDDWCFSMKKGYMTDLKQGGKECYHLYGISYYDKNDGKQLKKDIEDIYLNMPGGKDKLWDFVALEFHKKNYKLNKRDCKIEDIVEIDSFNELKAIDSIYNV